MNKNSLANKCFEVGASKTNITPKTSHFLFGYPFVERMSTGVHDWLYSSSLYLNNGNEKIILISNDVIYVDKESVVRIRKEVNAKTGVKEKNILIAATHTHSGPLTVDCVISSNDPIIPKVDKDYLRFMEEEIVKSACQAVEQATPAKVAFLIADGTGVGTNRHDPSGPKDMEVPVLLFKNLDNEFIASMLICSMHPTVLHEDSTLYSADFPFFIRETLQKMHLGIECPVIYFTGAAGNQSPRHVTEANTFSEAKRLGDLVANSIGEEILKTTSYHSDVNITCNQRMIELPIKVFPTVELAENQRLLAKEKFEKLREISSISKETRSAEVDWFGAEEIAFLAKLAATDSLKDAYEKCLPAEVQIIQIADWKFVAWPGEIFVEYALALKNKVDNTFLITIANGELQGYIPTKEAQDKGYYEASNSFFDYRAGDLLLKETIDELNKI